MKTRLLSTIVFALALAFSISHAFEKPSKSTKTSSAKKETKSCCMDAKNVKECSDKDMRNCDMKEAKASRSSTKAEESKKPATDAEVKEN